LAHRIRGRWITANVCNVGERTLLVALIATTISFQAYAQSEGAGIALLKKQVLLLKIISAGATPVRSTPAYRLTGITA
jgi:hypothetical protein